MSWSVRVKHDDKDCYQIFLRIGKSRWKVGLSHCYSEGTTPQYSPLRFYGTENAAWLSAMKEAVKLEQMIIELIGKNNE